MIRHIVMWSVRGDDRAAKARNIALLKHEFESLRGQVPGLKALDVGVDESRVDYACEVVLIADFSSRQALRDYASHPSHLRVRERLGDLRTARHQVDYEVADDPPEGQTASNNNTPITTMETPHVRTV